MSGLGGGRVGDPVGRGVVGDGDGECVGEMIGDKDGETVGVEVGAPFLCYVCLAKRSAKWEKYKIVQRSGGKHTRVCGKAKRFLTRVTCEERERERITNGCKDHDIDRYSHIVTLDKS